MQKIPYKTYGVMIGVLAMSAFAQDPPTAPPPPDTSMQQTAPNGGWHRVGDSNPSQNADPALAAQPADQTNPPDPPQPPPQYSQPAVPPQLTIKPGTYVTVRLNQLLSSDRNQAGDAFAVTLVRPVIVDGVVVAAPGQVLGGRVTEAKKAGRVEGTSRLGIELTDLPVVDGQQVPLKTQLISRNGPTSVGRDAAAIGGTTAVGAAIGAGVGWGTGAAIGAGAGAVVGILGVMLTRGHPTILGPETLLTFRIDQPVTISTEHAPYAFRFVNQTDYQTQQPRLQARPGYGPQPPPPGPGYYAPGYAGYPAYPAYPYYYPSYPYYWGVPGVYLGFGGFWGGGFYGRGFYGRGFRR